MYRTSFVHYVVGTLVTVSVVLLIALWSRPYQRHFDPRFSGTTAITVVSYPRGHEGDETALKSIKLTRDQTWALLRAIDLRSKEHRGCAHWTKLIFTTTHGEVTVSVCDHCFNIIVPDKEPELYEMPKTFWATLKPIVDGLRG